MNSLSRYCLSTACVLALACGAPSVYAAPTEQEPLSPPTSTSSVDVDSSMDTRDQRIRELEQRIEEQNTKIDRLQQAVEALLQQQESTQAVAKKAKNKSAAPSDGSAPADAENASADDSDVAEGAPQAGTEDATVAASPSTGSDAPEEAESEDPGPTPPDDSEGNTSASASARAGSEQQPEMNPNISLIVLGGAQSGGRADDPNKDSFFIREAELAVTAPVDPYTKLEAYVSFPKDENVELEEAFATYSGLPGGLQLRGGLLRNDFGRLNSTHEHALPQIDRPLPLTEVFGEEGLRSPGVEVSWLAPTPWYAKAIVEVGTRYGESEEDEFALFPSGGSHNPMLVARLENMVDLNQDTTLMLGLSHASSSVNNGIIRDSSAFGADLTLKWSPANEQYRNFTWQSEYISAKQNYVDPAVESKKLNGWYSYLSYRFNKSFRAGVRYDESDMANVDGGRNRRISGIVEFIANEWNALQLQYNHCNPTFAKDYDELLLQWNLVVGPHGAHKY